jgi:hypothetical protein
VHLGGESGVRELGVRDGHVHALSLERRRAAWLLVSADAAKASAVRPQDGANYRCRNRPIRQHPLLPPHSQARLAIAIAPSASERSLSLARMVPPASDLDNHVYCEVCGAWLLSCNLISIAELTADSPFGRAPILRHRSRKSSLTAGPLSASDKPRRRDQAAVPLQRSMLMM